MTHDHDRILQSTITMIKNQFPDRIMLGVRELAQIYGVTPESIYNTLRKNATSPFPKPVKRCGKWYWNIVQVAEDMMSGRE